MEVKHPFIIKKKKNEKKWKKMKKWKKGRPSHNLSRNLPILFVKNQEYTQKEGDFQTGVRPSWRYRAIKTIQQRTASEQVFKQVEEPKVISGGAGELCNRP